MIKYPWTMMKIFFGKKDELNVKPYNLHLLLIYYYDESGVFHTYGTYSI